MEKQSVIAVLASLAQETRLDVFRLLVQAGPEGVPAGSIATQLKIPAATLSFHLKELKSCGVVNCQREGRTLFYSPNFKVMNGLLSYLTENCCSGLADCGPGPGCNNEES
jgi:DNA-binding transcriptional ArsR family regulator